MEFFIPCWVALSNMFSSHPSESYMNALIDSVPKRIYICNEVALAAKKRNMDPVLAIAISYTETKFTFIESGRGAKGPLGVIPKYHCTNKDIENCDLIDAGLNAIEKVLDLADDDLCQSLALYNRGMKGRCKKGRSEYSYAQYVLDIYEQICASTDACYTC